MAASGWMNSSPTTATPASETILAEVNTFCTHLPLSTLMQLTQVSSAITAMATTCAVESPMVVSPTRPTTNSQFPDVMEGTMAPRYLANAMPTAAIDPDWITMNSVQP